MADKKKKHGKKGAKNSGPGKIPKTIAGIKIPKELRKSGEALIATAASPVGRQVLMTGLAAIVSKAATQMQQPRAAQSPTQPAPQPQIQPQGPVTTPPPEAPPFDPEAAGAQMARRVFEALGMVADRISQPPGNPPSRH